MQNQCRWDRERAEDGGSFSQNSASQDKNASTQTQGKASNQSPTKEEIHPDDIRFRHFCAVSCIL